MFLASSTIEESLEKLKFLHPFYGITFLACKLGQLPVGKEVNFVFSRQEKNVLDKYYKPYTKSKRYYQPFKTSKTWVNFDYSSSSSQRYRKDGKFSGAFLHAVSGSSSWGWVENYVEVLKSCLVSESKGLSLIPAFDLAVWLYRDLDWPSTTSGEDIVKRFLDDFSITDREKDELFDLSIPDGVNSENLFRDKRVDLKELRFIIGKPDDIPPDEGGTLCYLEIKGVGPASQLIFEPAERASLITGDNGLGKTFLLECAWWALTGKWAGFPAYPKPDLNRSNPEIIFQISEDYKSEKEPARDTVLYSWETQTWQAVATRTTIPGLVIYARVDGSFAVWDPAKQYWSSQQTSTGNNQIIRPFVFSKSEIWNGKKDERGNTFINGLLQDWIQWQNRPERYPFDTLKKVLERLSPPRQGDLGTLTPGEPVRLPYDVRDIPTIEHSYGSIPIVHASAGVQRIITIAYLIVWAWHEHKIESKTIHKEPQRRMVILVDELEAHLHPQWQRVILPAILDVSEDLTKELQVQTIVATHSPLVMASVEPQFDPEIDKLFHLDLVKTDRTGKEVVLQELPFIRKGLVDRWLISDVFELRHPRSLEAESTLEAAKSLQLQEDPDPNKVREVSEKLKKYLAENDPFWPRWVFFAEQHGADL